MYTCRVGGKNRSVGGWRRRRMREINRLLKPAIKEFDWISTSSLFSLCVTWCGERGGRRIGKESERSRSTSESMRQQRKTLPTRRKKKKMARIFSRRNQQNGWMDCRRWKNKGRHSDCKVTRFLTGDAWCCCSCSSCPCCCSWWWWASVMLAGVSCPLSSTRIGLSGACRVNGCDIDDEQAKPKDEGGSGLDMAASILDNGTDSDDGTSVWLALPPDSLLFVFDCLFSRHSSRILCTLTSISPTCFCFFLFFRFFKCFLNILNWKKKGVVIK